MNTMDIYFRVDALLMLTDYRNQSFDTRKEIIDMALTSYTLNKMEELGLHFVSAKNKPTLFELLALVDNKLKEEEKNDFFRHYTHYILKAITSFQLFEATWMSSDDTREMFVEYTSEGLFDSLNTPLESDPFETTKFIYAVFQNQIQSEKTQDGKTRNRLLS